MYRVMSKTKNATEKTSTIRHSTKYGNSFIGMQKISRCIRRQLIRLFSPIFFGERIEAYGAMRRYMTQVVRTIVQKLLYVRLERAGNQIDESDTDMKCIYTCIMKIS